MSNDPNENWGALYGTWRWLEQLNIRDSLSLGQILNCSPVNQYWWWIQVTKWHVRAAEETEESIRIIVRDKRLLSRFLFLLTAIFPIIELHFHKQRRSLSSTYTPLSTCPWQWPLSPFCQQSVLVHSPVSCFPTWCKAMVWGCSRGVCYTVEVFWMQNAPHPPGIISIIKGVFCSIIHTQQITGGTSQVQWASRATDQMRLHKCSHNFRGAWAGAALKCTLIEWGRKVYFKHKHIVLWPCGGALLLISRLFTILVLTERSELLRWWSVSLGRRQIV